MTEKVYVVHEDDCENHFCGVFSSEQQILYGLDKHYSECKKDAEESGHTIKWKIVSIDDDSITVKHSCEGPKVNYESETRYDIEVISMNEEKF